MRVSWRALGAIKYPLLVIAVAISILPTVIALSVIFKSNAEIAGPQTWLPEVFTLDNVIRVLGTPTVWQWIGNSAILGLGVAVLVLLLAVPAGYVLGRRDFAGRRGFLLAIVVTQTVAPAMLVIPLFRLLATLGGLNTYIGVIAISAAFVLPFSIWILTGFFSESLGREVEEAASLDGANGFVFLTRMLVPNSLPGIAATGVFAFMYGWNEYIFSLTFLSDQAMWPIAIGASSSIGMFSVDWAPLMATSILGTIPIMVMFLVLRKPLESGLTHGAA